MGFVQSASDPCKYNASEGEMSIVVIYVDDIVVGVKTHDWILQIKRYLCKWLKAKDMGELHHFLEIKIGQNHNYWRSVDWPDCIYTGYSWEVLYDRCKAREHTLDVNSKLMNATDNSDTVDAELYHSAVGSLLYLSVATRPDIAFAVSNVAKYCAKTLDCC